MQIERGMFVEAPTCFTPPRVPYTLTFVLSSKQIALELHGNPDSKSTDDVLNNS